MCRRIFIPNIVLLFSSLFASAVQAELTPEEVAIICVQGSRESRAVASYYAKVRNVPTDQIMQLDVKPGEDLSQEEWANTVRPAIRSWLAEKDLHGKVRCLVTVWDVPLRIRKVGEDPELSQLARYLADERILRVARIREAISSLNQIGGVDLEADSSIGPDSAIDEVKAALDKALSAAQGTILQMGDGPEKQAAQQILQRAYVTCLGLNMMAQSLARQVGAGDAANPQVRAQFESLRGRVQGLREGRAALARTQPSLNRDPQILGLLELSDGLLGSLVWIDDQKKTLEKNETYASFDSELALIAWEDYSNIRWQPNYLNYRFDLSKIRTYKPTYMVARLEAPTLKLTRKIIDDAIATEKEGLKGKVYLDARGLAVLEDTPAAGSYEDYDRALLLTADLIRKHTDLEVVMNNEQSLFQEGECPDAALYCGWYSLAKYVDAFDWVPGSVAFHMASSEAATLRNPESQVWCKRMLEDGVAATLGPAYEPYIMAFPRPNEFFALLLSGKYTLAECYFRCNPYNSWTMLLVGDPLYSPFRAAPALKMDGLDAATRRLIDGPPGLISISADDNASVDDLSTQDQPTE